MTVLEAGKRRGSNTRLAAAGPAIYPIEHGVLKPDPIWRGGYPCGKRKYPLRELGVGDSFLVPEAESPSTINIAQACWRMGCLLDRDFSLRVVADGVRVWRDR